jgi:hypothetical protein
MPISRYRPWRAAAAVALACSACAGAASAQSTGDPRAAQPERPTVATHAFTVAPGIFEIEAGAQEGSIDPVLTQWTTPFLLKIGLTSHLQLDIAPSWVRDSEGGASTSGVGDTTLGVKWHLLDAAPVLGAFAVQGTVTLPSGSFDLGTGTGTTGANLLLISSHEFRGVSIDINAGYTRRTGDGSQAPKNSTLWTVSSGFPVAGPVGFTLEVFGFPGTAGLAGSSPSVALLLGPTFTLSRAVVLDAGAILDLKGTQGTLAYAGVTWNVGRAWGGPHGPARPGRPAP